MKETDDTTIDPSIQIQSAETANKKNALSLPNNVSEWKSLFSVLPSSAIITHWQDGYTNVARGRRKYFVESKKEVSPNTKTTAEPTTDGGTIFTKKNDKSEVYLYIPLIQEKSRSKNVVKITNENTTATNEMLKKNLTNLFEETALQAISRGKVIRPYVLLSPRDAVKKGLYKTEKSAIKGITEALKVITQTRVSGRTKVQGRFKPFGKLDERQALLFSETFSFEQPYDAPLYTTWWPTKSNYFVIKIEKTADWRQVFHSFHPLPTFYYELSDTPASILLTISKRLRQLKKSVAENGYADISMKLIRQSSNLVFESVSPQREQIDPILDAVKEIMDKFKMHFGIDENNDDFRIEFIPPLPEGFLTQKQRRLLRNTDQRDSNEQKEKPKGKPKGTKHLNIEDFFNGKIRVYASKKFAEDIIKIDNLAKRKIEEAGNKEIPLDVQISLALANRQETGDDSNIIQLKDGILELDVPGGDSNVIDLKASDVIVRSDEEFLEMDKSDEDDETEEE